MSEYRTKVCFLGNSGVGKTCLLNRKTKDTFDENSLSTMGANYSLVSQMVNGSKVVLDCWDTAGQEKYRSLGRMFYADAHIVILVYDISSKESFEDIKNIWLKEVADNCEEGIMKIICANKFDLYEDEEIKEEDGREFAKQNGAEFCPTSAKSGEGVQKLFETAAKLFYERNKVSIEDNKKNKKKEEFKVKNDANNDSGIKLGVEEVSNVQKKKGKCC